MSQVGNIIYCSESVHFLFKHCTLPTCSVQKVELVEAQLCSYGYPGIGGTASQEEAVG